MNTRTLTHIAIAMTLLTIGAWIKIPFFLVPFSFQTLAVFSVALIFKPKESFCAIIIYLGMGLLGLPVFASGGGFHYLIQPSFGYLIGFVMAVGLVGKMKHKSKIRIEAVLLLGLITVYLCGVFYFIFLQNFILHTTYTLPWILLYLVGIFVFNDVLSLYIAYRIYKKITENHLL